VLGDRLDIGVHCGDDVLMFRLKCPGERRFDRAEQRAVIGLRGIAIP